MPMDAMFAKLGIAKPQLFFSQVTHLLTPIAVWRSAANNKNACIAHARSVNEATQMGAEFVKLSLIQDNPSAEDCSLLFKVGLG